MTDDHADTPATDAEDYSGADAGNADEDRPSSDTMSTPGGGPRRVVSSKGVDDILESLNSGPAASAAETEGAETKTGAEDGGATATDPTDTDTTETAVETESESESESEPGSESESRCEPASTSTSSASEALSAIRNGHEHDDHSRPLEDEGSDSSATATVSDSSTKLSFEESDVDGPEATSADATEGDDATPDPDDFAARLDSNAVTGADVRAAEAGEGREKTPEVDEIDLSMDDLERTRAATGGSSSSSTSGSGDGPLAGTIDPNAAGAATGDVDDRGNAAVDGPDGDDATSDTDSNSDSDSNSNSGTDTDTDTDSSGSGLLGRVRSLFSR